MRAGRQTLGILLSVLSIFTRFTLDQFLFFGGYPGAAPLIGDQPRWRRYIQESLVETTGSRDVLLLSRVDKPALLRQLYALGVAYSGQVTSYTKMLGQLQDAGNSTKLAHYAELLDGAGLLRALGRYSGAAHRTRGSIPKWQVLNTALMSAASGMTLAEARADHEWWGRLVESSGGTGSSPSRSRAGERRACMTGWMPSDPHIGLTGS